MANTRTSICNHALVLASQPSIVSITDDNPRARACLAVYDVSKNTVLGEAYWTFALYRAALSVSPTAPAFEFTHQFALPVSPRYIRLADHSLDDTSKWAVENGFFLCNYAEVAIQYVGETATGVFSDAFAMALSALIGSQVAINLDQDDILGQRLYAMYIDLLEKAKGQNAIARPARRKIKSYRMRRNYRRDAHA